VRYGGGPAPALCAVSQRGADDGRRVPASVTFISCHDIIFGMHLGPLRAADYRALAEFRYRLRRFLHFSERAARAAGLEPQQHMLLLALRGMPSAAPASIGVLAERLQIAHHSAVELVDRMEGRGLIRRARSRTDRRRVLVELTRRGAAVLPRLARAHRAELRSLAPTLLRSLRAIAGDRERPTEARHA